MRRPTLTITRGLPGSGKTFETKSRLAADHRLVRVNRDETHRMLFGEYRGDAWSQRSVTLATFGAIRELLRHEVDVISDDTNLPDSRVVAFENLAYDNGADLRVIDLRHVDLDLCLSRNAQRPDGERVPESKIISWNDMYLLDDFRKKD